MTAQRRILIADDESLIRMHLRETLVALGYIVVGEAADGAAALSAARQLRPDLAILDVKMPVLDGLQAAQAFADEGLAPVLLLTAYADRELVERACRAGVISYLVKPFREAELAPTIEVCLQRHAEQRARAQKLHELEDTLATRTVIDRAKGVLMDTQGLKEREAFRKMQLLAMNTRKPMRDVAEAILLAAELQA